MVGPRDTSGRFIYWPVRASLGGEMAVPGSPTDPIQMIDVGDLAAWIIHCIELNIVGVYNATGPEKELSMRGMVEGVRAGVGSKVTFTWIDNDFLQSQGIREGQFPLYEPPTGETAGAHRCNSSRAVARGLKFRPVSDTARATLEWYKSLGADLQALVAPQFAKSSGGEIWLDVEKRLLDSWHNHEKKR
jgi:2'-hydroxyisoflavone reductase